MNELAQVSEIMATNLVVVSPYEDLTVVDRIFSDQKIHHLPVVDKFELVGMVSKSDYLKFAFGLSRVSGKIEHVDENLLKGVEVSEIMTTGIAKLSPEDRIATAAQIFKENLFHAIPIVENKKLVGIVTTFDLINFCFQIPSLSA
ncbi:MAG: CBS domain-containing protein [Bacteroidota bacterium]